MKKDAWEGTVQEDADSAGGEVSLLDDESSSLEQAGEPVGDVATLPARLRVELHPGAPLGELTSDSHAIDVSFSPWLIIPAPRSP